LWKAAAGTTATITLQVSKGSAVMLLNTNATAVSVEVGSGESYALESGYSLESGYVLLEDEVAAIVASSTLTGSNGRFWADYSEFSEAHIVKIYLTAASAVYAGIVRAGNVEEFKDPAPSHEETSIDYSIEKELNNGANYYRKRNVVRTFDNLSMIESRTNAWKFKHQIFDAIGPQPLAIRLFQSANIDDWEFALFAKRSDPPELTHLTNDWTQIDFSLQEVI
jgi:hypothetical protein